MEGLGSNGRAMVWLTVMFAMLVCTQCRSPVLHRVGGQKIGWFPGVNYTSWSMNEVFYVGDWIYFGFDKRYYNVLEVNKTSYENCIDKDFILNITRGGRDVFNLTKAKPYYFLSGGGYCFHGMKVAIDVKDFPLSSPSPRTTRSKNCGASIASSFILLSVLMPLCYRLFLSQKH